MGCFPCHSNSGRLPNFDEIDETSFSFLKSSFSERISDMASFTNNYRKLLIKPQQNTSFKYEISTETYSFGHFGLNSQLKKAKIKASQNPVLIEKILLPELDMKGQETVRHFFRILDFLKNLDHPNILKIIDIYEEGEALFIVYEDFPEGRDLYERICETGGFSESLSMAIIQDILSLLCFLNNLGFTLGKISAEAFHLRDLEGGYQVKLMDITKIEPIAFLNGAKNSMKNEGYSRDFYTPPENPNLINPSEFKRESFSLGVLMFLMIKGRFPFNQDDTEENNDFEQFYNIKLDDLQFSPSATEFLKGLLEINPQKRTSLSESTNFFKGLKQCEIQPIEDIKEKFKEKIFEKPLRLLLRTLLVRFFGSQTEKDQLLKVFKEKDQENQGFLEPKTFGIEGTKKMIGFEDFLVLSRTRLSIDEKKAKELLFLEISKGNPKTLSLDNFIEFLGKEMIEKEIAETIFKGINGKGVVKIQDFITF